MACGNSCWSLEVRQPIKKDALVSSARQNKCQPHPKVPIRTPFVDESLISPRVEKIEIVRRAKVRQAKLYYLRELRGKAARLKELKTARPRTKVKKVKTRGKKAKAAKAAAKKA